MGYLRHSQLELVPLMASSLSYGEPYGSSLSLNPASRVGLKATTGETHIYILCHGHTVTCLATRPDPRSSSADRLPHLLIFLGASPSSPMLAIPHLAPSTLSFFLTRLQPTSTALPSSRSWRHRLPLGGVSS
jgi:hypothetical protein